MIGLYAILINLLKWNQFGFPHGPSNGVEVFVFLCLYPRVLDRILSKLECFYPFGRHDMGSIAAISPFVELCRFHRWAHRFIDCGIRRCQCSKNLRYFTKLFSRRLQRPTYRISIYFMLLHRISGWEYWGTGRVWFWSVYSVFTKATVDKNDAALIFRLMAEATSDRAPSSICGILFNVFPQTEGPTVPLSHLRTTDEFW